MIRGVLLDLDGTVYWGAKEVPGAAQFVGAMHGRNVRTLFVTNRSNRLPEDVRDHLRSYGIPCETDDVLTVSQATAAYLKPGRVYFIGEEGLHRPLVEAGFEITTDRPDYVIVSFDREFNYEKLKTACRLIGDGAKFVATNPDCALRTEQGVLPGTGAIVAAVAAGSGQEPIMIGKPEKLLFEMGMRRLNMAADEVVAVGDSLDTDIPAGAAAGMRTAFILTGVGRREDLHAALVQPTWVVEDFEDLLAVLDPMIQ